MEHVWIVRVGSHEWLCGVFKTREAARIYIRDKVRSHSTIYLQKQYSIDKVKVVE